MIFLLPWIPSEVGSDQKVMSTKLRAARQRIKRLVLEEKALKGVDLLNSKIRQLDGVIERYLLNGLTNMTR